MLPSLITVLMLISFTCGQNPAIQVTLTDKGLQYGKHVGAGWVQDKLELITLPDISDSVSIGIGTVHYTLTGMTITKCDFPEPSVEFYQNVTGFKASTSGLNIALKGGWRTRFGIIHDSGTFNMAIFNVDVTSVANLGKQGDGHLSVTSVSCDAQVGDVAMSFHGGASVIIQPFVNHFKGHIISKIQSNICPHVEEAIVNLEYHLQTMKVSYDVNEDLTLNMSLTNVPLIDASSLNLGLKGEFYSTKTHAEPTFMAQPFTMPQQSDYMLSMGLSDFTLNSASYAYFSAGLFQVVINDSMIPPSSPVHLNTSAMGPFIPQLPKMYPGLLMILQVYAREVPFFSFQPGGVKLGFQGTVKAFAIQPNGTKIPLFTLNIDAKFSGKVWIADGRLKGSMAMNNLTLTLVWSGVGPFETDAMQRIANMGAMMVLAKVNKILGEGLVLPGTRQAQLVNTVLEMREGFIAIKSDAKVMFADSDFNRQPSWAL